MSRRALRCSLWVASAGLCLAACGGGGGGASNSNSDTGAGSSASAAGGSTALASFMPPGAVPANFRAPAAVPQAVIEELAARLPASTGPRYLRIWAASPGDGTPEVFYLGRWAQGQDIPPVVAQVAMTVLHVELYNAQGGVQAEWRL